MNYALKRLLQDGAVTDFSEVKKVAHRVVHGGAEFWKPTLLNKRVLKKLRTLSFIAPLHNPANLEAITAAQKVLPKAQHFAIFDTAFHHTLPEKARLYGLSHALQQKEKIRRYGFHGTSHAYVAKEATRVLKKKRLTLITCHIGNGVSLCAIKDGKSLDTSMGFTPLEGPLMGTRSGTVDPGILFHLLKKNTPEQLRQLLEHESGFKGLSGLSSDIRELWAKPRATGTVRSFEVFSYQMAKLICSYFVPLGGRPAALVFTAGVGENAYYLRKQICDYLVPFGVRLNHTANRKNAPVISTSKSSVNVLVVSTDEEKAMAEAILSSR